MSNLLVAICWVLSSFFCVSCASSTVNLFLRASFEGTLDLFLSPGPQVPHAMTRWEEHWTYFFLLDSDSPGYGMAPRSWLCHQNTGPSGHKDVIRIQVPEVMSLSSEHRSPIPLMTSLNIAIDKYLWAPELFKWHTASKQITIRGKLKYCFFISFTLWTMFTHIILAGMSNIVSHIRYVLF